MKHSELRHQPRHVNPRIQANLNEQREWMKNMQCVKIELDGTNSIENNAKIIVESWNKITS